MMGDVLSGSIINFSGENAAAQPAVNRLGEITAPTLVLVGDLDDDSIQQASLLLADEIPAADRTVLSGAAHLPNLEKSVEFFQAVSDFLARTAMLDQESDLATGLGGAVKRSLVSPQPTEQRESD